MKNQGTYKKDFIYMKTPTFQVVKVGTSQEELTQAMMKGYRQVPKPEKTPKEK